MSGFGEPETIVLPYSASVDGILQMYARCKDSGNGYYNVKTGNRTAILQMYSGGSASGSFPVCNGESVTLSSSSNVGTVQLTFIPFSYIEQK